MPPPGVADAAVAARPRRRGAAWSWVATATAGAALLLLALAADALADTQGGSSPRSNYWTKDQLRSQPGKPPPPRLASSNATDPSVPYRLSSQLQQLQPLHGLVQSLNGTERGRQLLPLLLVEGGAEASAAAASAAMDGDYLLGYSHNPWGKSAAFRDVLDDLGGDLGGAGSTAAATEKTSPRRSRRSVLHLYNMLVCSTGCDPMAYKGYGCYCGFLGSGYTTDGIDRCCKMHDWCYDTASCPMFLEYFVPYLWKCYRGRPLCAVNGSACSQRLCECDRRLAECLRHYPCPRRKAVCTSSPWRLLQNLFML